MSNIFEALQNANSELQYGEKSDIAPVTGTDIPLTDLEVTMEQEMIGLYRQIATLLPDSPQMVLQFVGSRTGDGVSTIVREYASMAVTKLGKSVLILDANQSANDQQHFFRNANTRGWDEGVYDPQTMEKAISCIGDSKLYVSCLSRRPGVSPLLIDAHLLKSVFVSLKMRFDLILLDSSSVTSSTDSTVLSHCADGVLLVVEADKTRWPVIENLKTKIRNSGGNILGIVFNKRSYYIPEFLYKRL